MKYQIKKIRSDMFRIYPNRRQGGYDVKSIHTIVPRMCRTFNEAVNTMHVLLDLKQIGMEEEEAEPGEEGSGSEGEAGSADYQKRLDKVKKALNKLTSEYSLSKEDASYLIAVINDNTIFGRNEE